MKFCIIEESNVALLGRDFISKFGFKSINFLAEDKSEMNNLEKKYPGDFTNKIGCFNKFKLKLYITENAVPKFCKARPLPHALKATVEEELGPGKVDGVRNNYTN